MKWNVKEVSGDRAASLYHLSPLSAKLLEASGLSDEQIRELLEDERDPRYSKAPCVKEAAERLLMARENHEKVFIGGDYDADGICSTAIMKNTLDRLGIVNGYYIPDRFREGYGLRAETVEAAAAKGYSVIMTVDNGVKAHEALIRAKELGMYVIVTDHHQIDEEIEADIVVHPDYLEPEYANCSGAGVVLQLAHMLVGNSALHVALAAVAAIGDVMPLWKENRVIVKRGLGLLRQGAVPALSALLAKNASVDEKTVGFQIVPKLNSVGRMNDISNVNTLVPFLLLQDPAAISRFAAQLHTVNERRKELSAAMVKKAQELLTGEDFEVIYDPEFHEGLCGLAAGRIAEEEHKPVLVMAGKDDILRGSGRSVPGFNLFAFFAEGFDELEAFGGHEQAVGITVRKEDYENFRTEILRKIKETGYVYEEKTGTAVVLQEKDINFAAFTELDRLKPYPKELSDLYFALVKPEVSDYKKSPKVTKYTFRSGKASLDGVLFPWKGMEASETPELVCGNLSVNRWRDRITLQMEIEYLQ